MRDRTVLALSVMAIFSSAAAMPACSSGGGGTLPSGVPGLGALADGGGATSEDGQSNDAGKARRDGGSSSTDDNGDVSDDGGTTSKDAGKKHDAGSVSDDDASVDFDASTNIDSSPPSPTDTCTPLGTACTNNQTATFCESISGGTCTGARYRLGSTDYACTSCSDCSSAYTQFAAACQPSTNPNPNPNPNPGPTPNPTPTETCSTTSSQCTAGGDLQLCYTATGGGGCTERYVYNGQSYACAACGQCDAAFGQAYTQCMNAVGGCDALANCCATGTLPASIAQSCQDSVTQYRGTSTGEVSCKQYYDSYKRGGYCN